MSSTIKTHDELIERLNTLVNDFKLGISSIRTHRHIIGMDDVINELIHIKNNYDIETLSSHLYTILTRIYANYYSNTGDSFSCLPAMFLLVDTLGVFEEELLSMIRMSYMSPYALMMNRGVTYITNTDKLDRLTYFFKNVSPDLMKKAGKVMVDSLDEAIFVCNNTRLIELTTHRHVIFEDIGTVINDLGSERLKVLYLKEKLKAEDDKNV